MAKSDRLLQVMQLLRILPQPVQAETLAAELGTSQRTIYRDIDSLRNTGAVIDGAAGYGYTLIEDPALPPMMFSSDEIEALVLGLREVISVGDPVLSLAARNVLGKIHASLPDRLRAPMQNAVLHAKRSKHMAPITIDVACLRRAAREEYAVSIHYADAKGTQTERTIWPLSIVFMDSALMLLSKCQLRQDFRAFRVDRIARMVVQSTSFRPRRVALLRDYLALINAESENPDFGMKIY